ncbi:MAG: shikimate kinase [Candidatus Woesearchaeota archaeon]
MQVILSGPRSIGKSTVGKILAIRLSWQYHDLDSIVKGEVGAIKSYMAKNGLEDYRRLELRMLKQVISSAHGDSIISLGGGTGVSGYSDIDAQARSLIRSSGLVIVILPCIDDEKAVDILYQFELKRSGGRSFIDTKRLYLRRRHLYEAMAHIIIYKDDKKPESMVQEIINILLERSSGI